MDIQHLILAYSAAAIVALAVTVGFSPSITQMLFRLLNEDIAPHWSRFIRFALFAMAAAGGMPSQSGHFIDRNALPPPPPTSAEGLMLVMNSAVGALMAAAWFLSMFYGVTLTAITAGKLYALARQRKDEMALEAARLLAESKTAEEQRRREKPRSDSEPVKRMEPAEARPVAPEKVEIPPPPQRRH